MTDREGIILAGGLGTRLRSVVSELPKCMAPVAGHPFLYHVLKYMAGQRFSRVVLALGYMHEAVEAWITAEQWPFDIRYSLEEVPLGTGGAIRQAMEQTSVQDVFVFNGDTYFDVDLEQMLYRHRLQGAAVTLALKPMTHFSRYGVVETNEQHRIIAFREKQPCVEGRINGGIYLINKFSSCLESPQSRFSFETDILQAKVHTQIFSGYDSDGYFMDIGVPEDYMQANRDFQDGYTRA